MKRTTPSGPRRPGARPRLGRGPTIVVEMPLLPPRRVVTATVMVLPVGVAAAWVPLRATLPSVDIALPLVLSVGIVALLAGRWVSAAAATAAAAAFDFFDTPPYGQLVMTRSRDIVTTLVVFGAGLLIGEVCVRARSYRAIAATKVKDFTVMTGAARLMALGEDASVVVGALAGELTARLGLEDCEFDHGPPSGDHPCVARNGSLIFPDGGRRELSAAEIDLPVWAGLEVVGCYRLSLPSGVLPTADRLLAAVGIAEQAGAALVAARPPVLLPQSRSPRLRILR
jgi:hypothetical protein